MTKKGLKVAFPHMDNVYIIWGSLINALGGEAIIPPYTSKKTLSLGTKHSPEAICLPYKLVLGNFLEAIENGAEMLAMISSPGICRLGEYSHSARNAIKDLGYNVKYFNLDLYKGKFKEIYRFLYETTGCKNPIKIIFAINVAMRKIFVLDRLQNILSYCRARELKVGQAEKAFKNGRKLIFDAKTVKELKKAEKEVTKQIQATPIDENKEILKVDLTGEIFMVLDEFSNQNLEKELGKLGVQTRRSLTIGGWLKDAIIPKIFKNGKTHLERAEEYAKPYLQRDIGGDALESISDIRYSHEQGTDGIIHISPFTCMPEIMSQNIFPVIREDFPIPLLTLVMDEQTGRAGFVTRLEAFVDLMRRRKRQLSAEKF
ncbi:MAG: acyl-CoA dehydratase activase-related protein [Candidatus Gastranaerophilales bacterium]|nr:acyl-CoA dehydratase activase-related protein [Candidatus Gastranaerophilales bacterium]